MGGEDGYSYGDLARVPSFLKLWMGDLASQTSDRMAFVAITVMIYGLGGSSLDISLVMGAICPRAATPAARAARPCRIRK